MKAKYISNTFLIALMLAGNITVFAQEQPGLRERANQLYSEYKYAYAAEIYQKLADKKKPKLSDLERLADCYHKMNDYEAAETWYSRVVQDPASKADNLLSYGTVLKNNGRYAEAKKVLQDYVTKAGKSKKVENEIAGCDSAIVWLANPTKHQIKNESAINTVNAEFSTFPENGKLYYIGQPDAGILKTIDGRTGNGYLKVYSANRSSDNSLNTPLFDNQLIYNKEDLHVGPITGNKAKNVFYLTRTYTGKDVAKTKEAGKKYKTNNLELYIYSNNGNGWDIQPFQYNNVKQYSVGHAALSTDEKILYFVSDMPGGQGGTDIWYSELQTDGSWGQPKNAGTSINTEGDEMFPHIAADGTLYYSTNGLPGMGGLDIFSAKGTRNQWNGVKNMGYPVNSANDDFSFVVYGQEGSGYLSSNRKGGAGDDDIYSFSIIKQKIILALKGITYNKKTSEELPAAAVSLLTSNNQLVSKAFSKDNGTFYFELSPDTDYTILAQKEKFYADSVSISTKGVTESKTFEIALRLDPLLEKGKTIRIENIHYDFDKDNIRPDAAKILNELVRTLRDNPTLKIELASHTDSRGSDVYNEDLSQRRAQSAVNYLVSRGIARERLVAKGYGEKRLLNRCANGVACSVAEHQENRRTEFTILEF